MMRLCFALTMLMLAGVQAHALKYNREMLCEGKSEVGCLKAEREINTDWLCDMRPHGVEESLKEAFVDSCKTVGYLNFSLRKYAEDLCGNDWNNTSAACEKFKQSLKQLEINIESIKGEAQ